MNIVHYEKKKPFGNSTEDFLVTTLDFVEETKKIHAFSVLLVSYYGENVYEIIKYDTAHGYCHVHRFYKILNHEGERIDRGISAETFYQCRKDIKENWEKYKKAYFDKWLKR